MKISRIWSWCRQNGVSTFFATIAVISATNAFAYERYLVPSSSMEPTLLVGDYIGVEKYAYGVGPKQIGFDLGFTGRLFGAQPERGDIVVFRTPEDGWTVYVKRVIGLPGDRVQVKAGVLHVNGAPVRRERIADGEHGAPRYTETLPGGYQHVISETRGDNGPADDTQEYRVPSGHYFMMGDNRDNSQDSRWLDHVGYVPAENLIGRVSHVLYSTQDCGRTVLTLMCGVRSERTLQRPI